MAVEIDPGYAEELWIQESRFENIAQSALVISNERNARTEISVKDLICSHVPMLASFRESGKQVKAPAESYAVKLFTHGLNLEGESGIRTVTEMFAVGAAACSAGREDSAASGFSGVD